MMCCWLPIETIRNTIIETTPDAVGIILFGSYAQGTAREDSDMDFLVLTDRDYERKKKLQMLASLRWSIASVGYNADVLLKKERQYGFVLNSPSLIQFWPILHAYVQVSPVLRQDLLPV